MDLGFWKTDLALQRDFMISANTRFA